MLEYDVVDVFAEEPCAGHRTPGSTAVRVAGRVQLIAQGRIRRP